MKPRHILVASALAAAAFSCTSKTTEDSNSSSAATAVQADDSIQQKLDMYTSVRLTTDMSKLSDKEKQMLPLLIQASDIMNKLYWYEAYGKSDSLLAVLDSEAAKKFVQLNYGPWDRLNDNEPFIEGVGPKPAAANFYPENMTKEEFEQANLADKKSQYTFVRRDAQGKLITVPYHVQFKNDVQRAADLLKQAANLAEDAGLKKYLNLRAEALLTDNYQPSDLAWMDMKNNRLDLVIGPIETYEDQLFGYKASHEGYVLVKDMDWSQRLARFAAFLPELQRGLPIEAKYKKETPGSDADLNAYDVVYYAGAANAGGKTIAINLPNDEEVQLKKGTRRLQLKNAMRAKFDKIMEPIADELIVEDQQQHVTFDAFFANTMFHEVAHGLGIKNTINNKGTVREALKEYASALEEGKADILGLYMITQLKEKGELEGDLEDYYTTFLAGIFRSVRFGAADAHGQANMVRFNFFKEQGAFERDDKTGKYRVNYQKMREAMNKLSETILTLQGNGDYAGVGKLVAEKGTISPQLQSDLDRLSEKNIPVDIVFEQGADVLGLK
ncbi:dipeptidyl-peptidase 3 family protein [Pontibacter chitinilyticus]|uniref:dipeptidyl-peptidase 3 family protein n=1 Tax=Pontibacter chitinilyticus TaxID=2674989 RepID=UPI00321C0067